MPPSSIQFIPRHIRICKQCGTLNDKENEGSLPGNGWIELVLWLCYIIPGLIYSIWRRSKKNMACSACSSKELIQVGTPVGTQLARQYHPRAIVADSGPLLAPDAQNVQQHSVGRIFKALSLFALLFFAISLIGKFFKL